MAPETLLFAHGFAIHYRTVIPRKDIDVALVTAKVSVQWVRRECAGVGRARTDRDPSESQPSRRGGHQGMRALISDTAKWGELTLGPKIIDASVRRRMDQALCEIRSGKFAYEFMREMGRVGNTTANYCQRLPNIRLSWSGDGCVAE